METAKFKVGDSIEHKNYVHLGVGRILFISKFKKYTILFRNCYLKRCSEKYLKNTVNINNLNSMQYYDKSEHDESIIFYENVMDLCTLSEIFKNKNSDEYKHYSDMIGIKDMEDGLHDLVNEIIKNIQEQICDKIVNPNIIIKEKPLIQSFFEFSKPGLIPLHIDLQILRYLLEYTGGCDTIPPYRNGPYIFKYIILKFKGTGLHSALNILLDSGVDVEKIVWDIMNTSIHIPMEKDFRDYVLNILYDYLPVKNECSICFENIGYKISCCMRPESANYICHDCYLNTNVCPYCRDSLGMLINPLHERLINSMFSI